MSGAGGEGRGARGEGNGGLAERFRAGDARALARLITLVENGDPAAEPVLAELGLAEERRSGGAEEQRSRGAEEPGSSDASATALSSAPPLLRSSAPRPPVVVGLTGPPGAGKSTLAGALVAHWRGQGRRVAVLAIDPSSRRSGGAVLGDRVRLAAHEGDAGVFMRSMATRGRLGGVAAAAGRIARLLAAFGFDRVIVETAGVGQAETEIARLADVVVVIQVAGLGDDVQALKAGLLEIADIIAVNKADLPGAAATAAQVRAPAATGDAAPPVLLVSAATGAGVAALADAVDVCLTTVAPRSGDQTATNEDALRQRLLRSALAEVERRLASGALLDELVARVRSGELTAEAAAQELARSQP